MSTENSVRSLTIADDDRMNGGDDENHLTMVLVVNGTFHHLEAIRVVKNDGIQRAASKAFEDTVDAMFTIGGDGPFDTITIRGGTYVLVVIPFQ